MLRATIEIVPWGREALKRNLATVEIANIGGNVAIGDYACRMLREDQPVALAYIWHYPRMLGAEKLVRNALSLLRVKEKQYEKHLRASR